MRRVIGGKSYDTGTAECLAEISSGVGRSTELYRTRKGGYFLAHWTSWDGEQSTIQVIDADRARGYLEAHNTSEATAALEAYFTVVEG